MDESAAKKTHSKVFKPSELKKSPPLDDLITKYLTLQFGESRIVNMSPLTEMVTDDDGEGRFYSWSVKVDSEEATISVKTDGSSWVTISLYFNKF